MKEGYTYLVFITFVLFASCSFFQTEQTKLKPATFDKLESKYEPSEQFFLQRAYPDGKLDIKTYQTALQKAQLSAQQPAEKNGTNTPWTVQGPGNIGARINTIAVHPTNESIIYAGFSQGGVWKTIDGGNNWSPIFDEQTFLAIGDIAIDPNNPDIVYVGTGDPNISGYPFIGDGLYKSVDGGSTWTNIGLEAQRIISEIIVDPTNSNTLFVSTMGLPFIENTARGLYKTIDGGASWEQILFLSTDAGIIDMVMHPENTQILYAAGWNRIRNNYTSKVFGEAAKIFKTTNGGMSWTMLEGGLPQVPMGRIGLAISESNPETVFALYANTMSKLHHVYKSEDGGMLWDTLNTHPTSGLVEEPLGGFAWFFGKFRVNPTNPDDMFILGVDLWRSIDGGQSWFLATPPWSDYDVHADKHDLVFTSTNNILLSTDGGLYRANLFTGEWEDIENIPATQFYRVAYNPHNPDWYYGGAQDNGTTGGNYQNITAWPRIYGGDGFQALFHPLDPNIMFASFQRGRIRYSNDMGYSWESATEGLDSEDNRNWDMPYIMSPHNPNVLYAGTDRVYRSQTGGLPYWNPISDNLTDIDTSNSRYHNISTLDESPIIEGLLYVGTGDGNVHRSNNYGQSWNLITNGLPNQYITSIHASPNINDNVFVAQSGYRDNDNTPKIWQSNNRGDTWDPINGDLPQLAINDIWVYPNYQDSVIFVATDGGVYFTQNAGMNWERLGTGMPFIPVYDIAWNEAKNEVFAGTYARGIMSFPLDSLDIQADIMVTAATPIPNKDIASIKLYPNPTTYFLTVEFSNTEPNKSAEIVILDVQGKPVVLKENDTNGLVQENFNIQHLPSGQYFVKVKIGHGIKTATFIKSGD